MNFEKNIAHVVYASDDKFAEILGVSLISLYEKSQDMKDIIVYILDSGISYENKRKLLSITETYDYTTPQFIKAKDITKELHMNVVTDRNSLSQYARLFVSSVLPVKLNRVLYLDCDTIIMESIYELWNLNLQGKTIGALVDAFSKYYRANIDLKDNDIMFNSGVMLIDLRKWKDKKIEDKLLYFITKKQGKIQQGDQGALNAVLSHDTYCLEPYFNSVTIFYDFSFKEMMIYRRPPKFYTMEQIKKAVDKPSIVHFTTSFLSKRAWVKGCEHRYVKEWLKYKEISPWKNDELWEDNRSEWKKAVVKVFNILPRGFAIRFAGIMQVYGRPLSNRFRNRCSKLFSILK